MRVAYLINQYPKVSHSFIRREIRPSSVRDAMSCGSQFADGTSNSSTRVTNPNEPKTTYVLKDGTIVLLLSLLRTALGRPIGLFARLLLACSMARRSDRQLFFHFAYLAEACRILPWVRERGIQHIHAHFGTNSAEVAMLLHELGGPPWSFTVHGPDEFDRKLVIGLAEKVRRCNFVVAISSFGRAQLYRLVEYPLWSKDTRGTLRTGCGVRGRTNIPLSN